MDDNEIEYVLTECLRESGIELPVNDVRDLCHAIIDEGKGGVNGGGDNLPENVINIDQLKRAFSKHPELLNNLTFM